MTAVLRPTADGGNDSADWENTTGTACNTVDCSLEVRETSGANCTNSDGDASFIQSSTNGSSQTFNLDASSIPDNSIITQIDVTVCQERIGTSPGNKFQTRRCIDGVCANSGADLGASGAYTENTQSHTGLSATKLSSTDIEVGISVTGTNAKTVRVSQVSAIITYTPRSPPPSPPPTLTPALPSSGGAVRPTSVFVTGQAYPGSKIEFLRKSIQDEIFRNTPDATSTVFVDGTFRIQLIGLLQGEYLFALRAEDKDGRKTGIIALNADLRGSDLLSAQDILVPPTLEFEKAVMTLGGEMKIKGYAASERKIGIEIDGILKGETTSDKNGFWSFATSTASFRIGDHYARARQTDVGGKVSPSTELRTSEFSTF
ncbi:MAG: hypothetical protein Q8R36_02790, partial [bacterium]|nr:hypothetical protein [bacterium]